MDQKLFERFPAFPDRTMWPASLVDALDSGNYDVIAHEGDQVLLLSAIAGDLIQVQGRGTVQARMAINLQTGAVVRPPSGVNTNRWQAEVFGKLERYEQRRKEQRERPLDMSKWDFVGHDPGIPKNNC